MAITPETKQIIFDRIKIEMEKCCPPLVVTENSKTGYQLIGNKPVPYGYKKEIIPGMYFASIVVRKDNVSFYFFSIYMDLKSFEKISPALLKCLDGKTCFHFRKDEQVNVKELSALLKKGVQSWKKLGYVKQKNLVSNGCDKVRHRFTDYLLIF